MWIARDKDGHLVLFTKDKPIRLLNDWQDQNNSATWVYIDDWYTPTLTWEDEPIEVNLVSKSIDEKKLDKFADEYAGCEPTQNNYAAFKAGYRKAMEE